MSVYFVFDTQQIAHKKYIVRCFKRKYKDRCSVGGLRGVSEGVPTGPGMGSPPEVLEGVPCGGSQGVSEGQVSRRGSPREVHRGDPRGPRGIPVVIHRDVPHGVPGVP